jgi:hypothetical protein
MTRIAALADAQGYPIPAAVLTGTAGSDIFLGICSGQTNSSAGMICDNGSERETPNDDRIGSAGSSALSIQKPVIQNNAVAVAGAVNQHAVVMTLISDEHALRNDMIRLEPFNLVVVPCIFHYRPVAEFAVKR